jgi:hypothetical protein
MMFKSIFDRLGVGFRRRRAQLDVAISPVEATTDFRRVEVADMSLMRPGDFATKLRVHGNFDGMQSILACGEHVERESIITLDGRPFRVIGLRYFGTSAIFEGLVIPSPDRATVIHSDRPMAD